MWNTFKGTPFYRNVKIFNGIYFLNEKSFLDRRKRRHLKGNSGKKFGSEKIVRD